MSTNSIWIKENVVKKWVTCYIGDKATVISDHGSVLIIECNGSRLAVKRELVSETFVRSSSSNITEEKRNTSPSKSKSKENNSNKSSQTTLF